MRLTLTNSIRNNEYKQGDDYCDDRDMEAIANCVCFVITVQNDFKQAQLIDREIFCNYQLGS